MATVIVAATVLAILNMATVTMIKMTIGANRRRLAGRAKISAGLDRIFDVK
jgi:hypothetical protein